MDALNTPETSKVMGSNLTMTFFFSNGKYSVSKKLWAYYLSAYVLSA